MRTVKAKLNKTGKRTDRKRPPKQVKAGPGDRAYSPEEEQAIEAAGTAAYKILKRSFKRVERNKIIYALEELGIEEDW